MFEDTNLRYWSTPWWSAQTCSQQGNLLWNWLGLVRLSGAQKFLYTTQNLLKMSQKTSADVQDKFWGLWKNQKKSRFFPKIATTFGFTCKTRHPKKTQKYAKPLKTQKNRFCFCSIFFKNASIHTILSSEGVEWPYSASNKVSHSYLTDSLQKSRKRAKRPQKYAVYDHVRKPSDGIHYRFLEGIVYPCLKP